jgi:deoxyribodipyrimidine photo-lyase
MNTVLVWFRSDLRLTDNQALAAALAHASHVVPVYVAAPDGEPGAPRGARRWWLHHSLLALEAGLAARGAPLVVVRGPSATALSALARTLGAGSVYWNRRLEPALAAEDRAVAAALGAAGIGAAGFGGALLLEPGAVATRAGEPFRVFTPFWRASQPQLAACGAPLAAPAHIPSLPAPPDALPVAALGLLPRGSWADGFSARFTPGEAAAQRRLAQFLDESVAGYPEQRDRPDRPGTSRLSPHLASGELSPRQLLAAATSAALLPGSAARARGVESFVRQLGWREFAQHVLHHFPATPEHPLVPNAAPLVWRDDPEALAAWQQGRTGIPLVDAGMRELWHTGWMHNRVRMVVASFLTKNLLLDWRLGARWFLETLLDADLANNTLGWQWAAGCGADAAPYYRIFNPVLQAERFDPERAYLRCWLPELAALPDEWLHRPDAAPPSVLAAAGVVLGRSYPQPIVGLAASRARALEALKAVRAARSTSR